MSTLSLPVEIADERRPLSRRAAETRRLTAFGALALFGALRWNTMLKPGAGGRLLSLVVFALVLSAVLGLLGKRRALLRLVALVPAAGVALVLSGWPLQWVLHVRLALIWRSVERGLSALPRAPVPYNGINGDVRHVIVLGAAALLVLAALTARRAAGEGVRASRGLSAIPLLALVVLPGTLVHPALPALEGLLLLVLVALYLWADHPALHASGLAALTLVVVAGLLAIPATGSLREAKAWVDPSEIAADLAPAEAARFDWTQTYGALHWPRTGHAVFSVQGDAPAYWKTEDLDLFDGRDWALVPASPELSTAALDPAALARWTQTLTVTIRGMHTQNVLAAGVAERPQHLAGVVAGASPGTWLAPGGLGPGDTYQVRVYVPTPSEDQLAAVTQEPPYSLADLRTITLPAAPVPLAKGPATGGPLVVSFGAFGAGGPRLRAPGLTAEQTQAELAASPYGGVYTLARRLMAGAATPYAVARRALRLLGQGYRYDERPPQSDFPLANFLLHSRAGYCQHFAGAMALLLRMAGVPARVATGFTTGDREGNGGAWVVDDVNAHAWVEVWFPRYGWVTFDPTPAIAPERSGLHTLPIPLGGGGAVTGPGPHGLGAAGLRRAGHASGGRAGTQGRPAGDETPLAVVAGALLLVLLLLAAARAVRLHEPDADALVVELEQALQRLGRPLPPGSTLAALEHRLRDTPQAAEYVRTLRLTRYAAPGRAAGTPDRAQRRALRRELRRGGSAAARMRALWALPPLLVLLD